MQILFNGKIYTQDPSLPAATALAIEQDQIIAVGSDDEILALAGRNAHITNMGGKTVWPGLTDAHIHLENYALTLQYIDCETNSRAECLERVRKKAATAVPGQWIRGHGWNQNSWPEGFGRASDLDSIAPHHPVYLTAKSLHASWANSLALQKAGINASTPDPVDGKIGRDLSGLPTGILLEAAMGLVEKVIPELNLEQTCHNLVRAQTSLWEQGITGVHDYDRVRCFRALQILDQEKHLHLRVVKSIPYEFLPQAVAVGLRTGFGSRFLRIGSVKMFADGALGPQTAAMLQPYENDNENTGILFLDSEEIVDAGIQAAQSGLSLAIHAIGDRANHEVLDAYAQLREFEMKNGLPELRHRIEHVQILHPNDLNRLADLRIIASVQPIHAPSDMLMADRYWGKRSASAYAYGSLRDTGAVLAFGSDAPVEPPNPFLGIYAAVTRQRTNQLPGPEGWYPRERLSLAEAIKGFTIGPALAANLEHQLGKLAPGYFADLILLDLDPFSCPAQDLYAIQPVATMVAGEWVWQKE